MKRNSKRSAAQLFLSFVLFFWMITLSACSGNLDTDQNAELFSQSALSALDVASFPESYGTVSGSWLAVRRVKDKDGNTEDRVIGCSEDDFSPDALDHIETLILCTSRNVTESYEGTSTGIRTAISSEKVTVSYYDLENGTCYGKEEIFRELPKKTTSTADYTVSNSKILSVIEKRISSGVCPIHETDAFEISKKGVLRDVDGYDWPIVVIPESVTEIETTLYGNGMFQFWTKTEEIYIPNSVISMPKKTFSNRIVLVVGKGSYGEQFAIENGLTYRYRDE